MARVAQDEEIQDLRRNTTQMELDSKQRHDLETQNLQEMINRMEINSKQKDRELNFSQVQIRVLLKKLASSDALAKKSEKIAVQKERKEESKVLSNKLERTNDEPERAISQESQRKEARRPNPTPPTAKDDNARRRFVEWRIKRIAAWSRTAPTLRNHEEEREILEIEYRIVTWRIRRQKHQDGESDLEMAIRGQEELRSIIRKLLQQWRQSLHD